MIERCSRKAFVPSPRRSWRCRLDALNVSPAEKRKLSKRLTWKQGSEGGRTADGNVVLIFPPALGNRLAFYDFFFFPLWSAHRITSSRYSRDCTPCYRRSTAVKTCRSSPVRPPSRYLDQRTFNEADVPSPSAVANCVCLGLFKHFFLCFSSQINLLLSVNK